MKSSILFLLLLIPISIFSEKLSKNDVLTYAFKHSENLRIIENEMASAQSLEKEYRGKGLPTIEASVNYKYAFNQYNPYSFDIGDAGNLSAMIDQDQPGFMNDATIAGALDQILSSFSDIELTPPPNAVAMELSLTQPIYAQGKISRGRKAAKMYHDNLTLKYENTKLTLAKEITNAYNSAILADQNHKVQKQAVSLAQETHKLTKARLESGKGNVLDTLNSKYSQQQSKFELREAEKNRYMAFKKLFTLASMDKDPDSIELTDSLAVVEFTISEGEAIDLMLNKNLSLKQIDNGIQLHQMQIEIAKCDFFPTVYAGASVSKISMFDSYDRTSWGDDQKIFIGASIPIYSGGQKVQKVKQVSFEEQSLHETKRKTISQLTLALNNYFEELAVAREECIEARHLISLTEQGVEISSLSYEIGQITQNELTQSKQHLSMSQLAYNNAVYKLNTAIANIKMLLGDETLLSTKVED